jgi:hypothetical protein
MEGPVTTRSRLFASADFSALELSLVGEAAAIAALVVASKVPWRNAETASAFPDNFLTKPGKSAMSPVEKLAALFSQSTHPWSVWPSNSGTIFAGGAPWASAPKGRLKTKNTSGRKRLLFILGFTIVMTKCGS